MSSLRTKNFKNSYEKVRTDVTPHPVPRILMDLPLPLCVNVTIEFNFEQTLVFI